MVIICTSKTILKPSSISYALNAFFAILRLGNCIFHVSMRNMNFVDANDAILFCLAMNLCMWLEVRSHGIQLTSYLESHDGRCYPPQIDKSMDAKLNEVKS